MIRRLILHVEQEIDLLTVSIDEIIEKDLFVKEVMWTEKNRKLGIIIDIVKEWYL